MYQNCPKCNGTGSIPNPKSGSITSLDSILCPVCNSEKIIHCESGLTPSNHRTWLSENKKESASLSPLDPTCYWWFKLMTDIEKEEFIKEFKRAQDGGLVFEVMYHIVKDLSGGKVTPLQALYHGLKEWDC